MNLCIKPFYFILIISLLILLVSVVLVTHKLHILGNVKYNRSDDVFNYTYKYDTGTKLHDCGFNIQDIKITKNWINDFILTIPSAPTHAFIDNKCISINENNYKKILANNATIETSYGPHVTDKYKYNLSTDKFICDTQYYVDYENGHLKYTSDDAIVNMHEGGLYNLTKPCIDKLETIPAGLTPYVSKHFNPTYIPSNEKTTLPVTFVLKYNDPETYKYSIMEPVNNEVLSIKISPDKIIGTTLKVHDNEYPILTSDDYENEILMDKTQHLIFYPYEGEYTSEFKNESNSVVNTTNYTIHGVGKKDNINDFSNKMVLNFTKGSKEDYTLISDTNADIKFESGNLQINTTDGRHQLVYNSKNLIVGDIKTTENDTANGHLILEHPGDLGENPATGFVTLAFNVEKLPWP